MQPETQTASALNLASCERVDASGCTVQFITFTLGDDEYGIDIMVVREIKGWINTTMIPNSPSYVRGVINLRGIIVPVFDLSARFGWGQTTPTSTHVVIIVAVGKKIIGILVDAVSDIITVDAQAVRKVPEMELPSEGQYLEGLVAIENRMVTLVSLIGLFGRSVQKGERQIPPLSMATDAA